MAFVLKWATKLAIVGSTTALVINHDVFGTNRYTEEIMNKIRTSLPDTAEAFDQLPPRQEVNNAVIDTWNSSIQKTFKWFIDMPIHTHRFLSSIKS